MAARRGFFLPLLLLAVGCPGTDADPADPGAPAPEAWTPAHTARVQEACGRCHPSPPPGALPRARWAELIPEMATMPLPSGAQPLSDEESALAAAYYAREAPVQLEPLDPGPVAEGGPRFRRESFTPPGGLSRLRAPAVGNVQFVHLSDARRWDLLVSEMRSGMLMLLAPWAPPEQRALRVLAKDLLNPVHAELADLNGDRRPDLLVAGLGAMNPSNETRGQVLALFQDGKRRFHRRALTELLGRPADARPMDLDGDGDQDVVVCAFGWRGPGKLLWLENQSPQPAKPRFVPHELDARDGFIHAEPLDLNGDGRLDLVTVLAQEHEQVLAFVQEEPGSFRPRVLYQAPHPAWGSSGLQLVDLDGDGDRDVLLSNGDTLDDDLLKPYHGAAWLENQGEGAFAHHRIGALYGCERAIAADLDGDGDQDVVAGAFLPQVDPAQWEDLDSLVWFEQRPGGWTRRVLERGRCIHPSLAAADYDADGDVDLAVANYVWMLPEGRPTFEADCVTLFTQE